MLAKAKCEFSLFFLAQGFSYQHRIFQKYIAFTFLFYFLCSHFDQFVVTIFFNLLWFFRFCHEPAWCSKLKFFLFFLFFSQSLLGISGLFAWTQQPYVWTFQNVWWLHTSVHSPADKCCNNDTPGRAAAVSVGLLHVFVPPATQPNGVEEKKQEVQGQTGERHTSD